MINFVENCTASAEKRYVTRCKQASGSNTTNINVQNLISGLYIVVVEVDGVSVADANLIVIH